MEKKTNGAIKVEKQVLVEIENALKNIKGWGSVEIFIQNYKVVQITERNIRKTRHDVRKI